jgi:Tol biopolymer transport system component
VGSLDGEEPRRILNASSTAWYADPGYLLFVREATLMAQPFDASRIELTGDAFPIAEEVLFTPTAGVAVSSFSVSENGVLAYRTGGGATAAQFAWLDRTGKELERFGEQFGNAHLAVSPGERSLAIERIAPEGRDLWLRDITRGTTSRFAQGLLYSAMVWSPDGNWLTFAAARAGVSGIYQKLSSGAGQDELLLNAPNVYPTDRSRDGKYLLYFRADPKTRGDLWVLPLSGDPSAGSGQAPLSREAGSGQGRQPKPFLQSEFNEGNGQFSPDGRWVAYISDESGRLEVYVQPFPGPGAKWQISTDGGILPKWRADGKELFYFNQSKVIAVDINAGERFAAGVPRVLFEVQTNFQGIHQADHYAVSADGKRFLFALPREEAGPAYITVVQNWTAGVKR